MSNFFERPKQKKTNVQEVKDDAEDLKRRRRSERQRRSSGGGALSGELGDLLGAPSLLGR